MFLRAIQSVNCILNFAIKKTPGLIPFISRHPLCSEDIFPLELLWDNFKVSQAIIGEFSGLNTMYNRDARLDLSSKSPLCQVIPNLCIWLLWLFAGVYYDYSPEHIL